MAKRVMKCPICGEITTVKGFSLLIFLILCLCGGFPALVYVLIKALGKKKCTKCSSNF